MYVPHAPWQAVGHGVVTVEVVMVGEQPQGMVMEEMSMQAGWGQTKGLMGQEVGGVRLVMVGQASEVGVDAGTRGELVARRVVVRRLWRNFRHER